MWSRFQTAAIIEGAMLYGLYQIQHLGMWEKRVLVVIGTIFVALVCILSWKDRTDAAGHLKRIKEFEAPVAPFHPDSFLIPGAYLMNIASVLLTAVNLTIVWNVFISPQ